MAEIAEKTDVEQVVSRIAAAGDAAAARPSGAAYDFGHPDLLSRDLVRALRMLHDGYAQALARRLSTDLLSTVTAQVGGVEHLTYSEFQALLSTPTVLGVVEVPALDGKIAIDVDPALAFAFLDRLLGGPGVPLAKVRALTAIEMGLMDRVLRRACHELSVIWKPIVELGFELQSIEANPELVRVISPEEMVVLIAVELGINETRGRLSLCLPYVVMEPAIHRLGTGTAVPRTSAHDGRALRESVGRSLRDCPVTVDVDLGTVTLPVGEMLALEPGDVLRIEPGRLGVAHALVQGTPRLLGVPGTVGGRRAFQVTEVHSVTPQGKGKKP